VNAADLFGMAVGAAGWLLACALAARQTEALHEALGLPERGDRGRAEGPGALTRAFAARAARRAWPWKPWSYVLCVVGTTASGLILGWHLAGPVGALAASVGSPMALEAFLSRRLRADADRLESQLREAVATLSAAVRAGLSVRRGLEEAADGSESPLREHLRSVIHRMRMGEPPEVALARLESGIDLPDLRLLVNALSVDRRTGGNLPALLDEIGRVIAQRSDARREVRILTAQGRASGAVLAALPVAFVALLSGTGGPGLGAFYRTPVGSALLAAGLACAGAGHMWIRRILATAEAER
jgi:tight adherence protein B